MIDASSAAANLANETRSELIGRLPIGKHIGVDGIISEFVRQCACAVCLGSGLFSVVLIL